MKVQIRDRDALESLTAPSLRAYLKAHGWVDAGQWGERPIVIYGKEQGGRKWEILVPLRDTASDYAESMAWAITALADAEDRSQLEVFYDLASAKVGAQVDDNTIRTNRTANVWCVRAYYGKYTEKFTSGGFAAIGWIPDIDLSLSAKDKTDLYSLYRRAYPQDEAAKNRVGTNVGQISRFLLVMKTGDFVITPAKDSSQLLYGRVATEPYYDPNSEDILHNGQPWPHRRKVEWAKRPLDKNHFSEEFSNTMRAALTVFAIRHREEFLSAIVNELWANARWTFIG